MHCELVRRHHIFRRLRVDNLTRHLAQATLPPQIGLKGDLHVVLLIHCSVGFIGEGHLIDKLLLLMVEDGVSFDVVA